MVATQAVKRSVLAQHVHSYLVSRCSLFHIERNVKLGNNIPEKELFSSSIYSVWWR